MTTETPPIVSLLPDDGRPTWQQVIAMFLNNRAGVPPTSLRNEIVALWLWAHYGQALARRSIASAEPAVAFITKAGLDKWFKGDGPENHVLLRTGSDMRVPLYASPPPPPVASEEMVQAGKEWFEANFNGMPSADSLVRGILTAALSPAPAGEVGWRTMDSAPKDGTPILAYRAMCGWEYFVVKWIDDRFFTLDSDYNPFTPGWHEPTHWMSLPASPTGGDKS